MLGKRLATRLIKRTGQRLGLEIRRSARTLGNMDAFLRHLRNVGFSPAIVLDVGANKAEWSRHVHAYFTATKFVLVEPQMEMGPHLEAFCREVPGSRWVKAGAGREAGELVLTVWPDLAGSSLLGAPSADDSYERRTVPIVTIDSLFADGQEPPQLVKLDVQGFELEALAGASSLFGRTECFILEVSLFKAAPTMPVFADVVAYFDQRGYKVYDIPGHLRRPRDNALGQVDLAFVRNGGVFDKHQEWA